MRWLIRLLAIAVAVCSAPAPRALVFYATDDPAHNTSKPEGALAGSGWELEGDWRGMTGTPIASNLFLTAKHIQGNVGDLFYLQGRIYPTLEAYPDPDSDLMIWKVCGTFPSTATLCSTTNELDKPVLLFGRGLVRGGPVVVTNHNQQTLHGWQWGGTTGTLRWGQNRIAAATDGAANEGAYLIATFDADGDPEETALAGGDSGGGWFIQTEAGWQLAAISYAVDGPFDFTGADAGFNASVFDTAGLYLWNGDTFVLTPDAGAPQPAAMYGTRISARMSWINSIRSAQTEGEAQPVVQTASRPDGPYADDLTAAVHTDTRTISLPLGESNLFIRLSHCRPLRLLEVMRQGAGLELRYE